MACWWQCDLRRVIAERFGVVMHEHTVGKPLNKLGYMLLLMRPQHPKSDPEAQKAFKKLLPEGGRHSPRRGSQQARRDLVSRFAPFGSGRSRGWPARLIDPHLGS
ncbi:winged helix-turn-helix domain-containing protein [uncultured Methylobacterium sp.]|uniref:helix-turn-helix domain-containing protein n=1 Tax=uncultured Methylobacterium sp. TaxID=157278 RepID=UPI0035C97FA2